MMEILLWENTQEFFARLLEEILVYVWLFTSLLHDEPHFIINVAVNIGFKDLCAIMPLVFLFYLLCAVTDCPPPVVHNRPNANNPIVSIFNSSRRLHTSDLESSPSDNRFTRSNDGNNQFPDIPVVSSEFGTIKGRYMKSRRGRRIAAFEGIPYVLPPIGELRFRNPVPIKPDPNMVYIADHHRSDCLQLDFSRMLQVRGAEDCLYLSIYQPDLFNKKQSKGRSKPLLPVLVFIHGGGWMSHSSTPYGPKYLLDKDVILVSFNFRLGILGFLSTSDHYAPGNFGLKDQVVALQWIRNHIKSFGGDPSKITLIGESTGGGSAALHMISPLTSSLIPIQGAIMLSGTSFNHWAVMNDTFMNTKAIAKRMGCPTSHSLLMVECLRRSNPYMVVGQQLNIWRIPLISRLLFGPVVESNVNNDYPFLVEDPKDTYKFRRASIKHIPVIAGMNRDEGALFAANAYLVPFLFSAVNGHWDNIAPYIMAYDRLQGVNPREISEKIRKFYFNGTRWSFDNRDKIGQALGDRTISTGVYKFLENHSPVAPTYGYFFTYKSKYSVLKQIGLRSNDWGVSHGDELPLIFSMDQVFDESLDPEDIKMSEFLAEMCVNFASMRQPMPQNVVAENVTWSPIITPKYMQVLEINKNKRMISFPFLERMKFWEGLNLM